MNFTQFKFQLNFFRRQFLKSFSSGVKFVLILNDQFFLFLYVALKNHFLIRLVLMTRLCLEFILHFF